MASNATTVFWTNGVQLLSAPTSGVLDGGAPSALVSNQNEVGGLAIDSSSIYWTTTGSSPLSGTVMMMPLGGGAATTLASGRAYPSQIVTVGSTLYWIEEDASIARLEYGGP